MTKKVSGVFNFRRLFMNTTVILIVAGIAFIFKDKIIEFFDSVRKSKPQLDLGDLLGSNKNGEDVLADAIKLAKTLPEDSPERKAIVEKVIPALSRELLK